MHQLNYSYSTGSRRNRKKKKKTVKLFLVVFFLLIVAGFGLGFIRNQHRVISPIVSSTEGTVEAAILSPSAKTELARIVTTSLEGSQGTYAVIIKNLKTNESFSFNENVQFKSASLYKLWIMEDTFFDIKNGTLKEDDVLSKSVEDLNNEFAIATDDAELTDGTMTFPVSQALNQMITISHNYAALLLSDKIGLSHVQALIHQEGLTSSTVVAPPRTTAHDIALFYEKLYAGQLIDRNYSDQMLDLLKKQTLNDRIPAELPESTAVAHKTGELDGYKHDAGIVYGPKGDYIIVLMSNTQDPQIAVQKMADLSKAVYDYFEK